LLIVGSLHGVLTCSRYASRYSYLSTGLF